MSIEAPAAVIGNGHRSEEQLRTPEGVEVFRPEFIEHHLSILRDQNTQQAEFRASTDAIFRMFGMHLAGKLKPIPTTVTTLTEAESTENRIDGSKILTVAILRSGLPMAAGITEMIPGSKVAMVDIKRDEKTSIPEYFYSGLPEDLSEFEEVWIPDPMLATGGSNDMAIEKLRERGAKKIRLFALIAAPEGLRMLREKYPDIEITVCSVDERLNGDNFIVPGLGDLGNRYFGVDKLIIIDHMAKRELFYEKGKLHHWIDLTNEQLEEIGPVNFIDVPLAA
jgi:uracil phosphoribosyltransferase